MTRPAILSLLAVVGAAAGSLALAAPSFAGLASDWSKSADAICVRYHKEAVRIAQPTSSKSLITASQALAAIEQRKTRDLAKLRRPAGEAAAIGKLIGFFEQQVVMLRNLIDAVKRDDGARIKEVIAEGSAQNESAVRLAKKLGAVKCAG